MSVAVSERAGELLVRENRYPLRPSLAPVVFPHRRDVLRIVTWILDRVPKLECVDGIRAMMLDNPAGTPDIDYRTRSPAFVEHFLDLLARAILAGGSGERRRWEWFVLTACDTSKRLHAKGTVALAESVHVPEESIVGPYEGFVDIVPGPAHVCELTSVVALWLGGKSHEGITMACHQMQGGGIPRWPILVPSFLVGRNFLGSATALGFGADATMASKLLRACAETILGLQLQDVHPIRIARGGGARDRIRGRDGAKAQRRDIDSEYHLHYWSTPGGPVLADVVRHNDFGITE